MGFVGKITLDADTFRALASSTRLTVLKSLDERRKTLTELSRDLALNKATVHEHMALLTAAGLVKKRDDEGRKWIYYELTWTGQRILHPEATTTFNLLLALSVAAAGGGVAMLGKALGWWFEDTIASRQSDGAETQQDTALSLFAEEEDAMSQGSADAPAMASGSSTATGTPAPAAGSSGTAGQSTGTQSTGAQTATGAQTGAAPEGGGGAAYDQSVETEERLMLKADDGDSGDGGAGGDGDAGLQFFDDGGWIGLALLLTCALFLGLALVLQRKFVPKPLDETSATEAERSAGGQGPGGPPPPGPRQSR